MPRVRRFAALIALGVLLIAVSVALPGGEGTAAAANTAGGGGSSVSEGIDLTADNVAVSPAPDPVDVFGGRAELKQRSTALQSRGSVAPADEFTALCSFGGTSGKRLEVICGVPQDRPNRYAEIVAPLSALIRQASNNLEAADTATSQNYRFLCPTGVDVTIRNVTLLPVGADGVFTFADYVLSLKNQISAGLGPVNFSATNRIYIAYVDQIQDVYPYGGQGDLINDDQPDPATSYLATHGNIANSGFLTPVVPTPRRSRASLTTP